MRKYVLIALLATGCGTQAPVIEPSRMDVTDTLRVACGPVGFGDTQIASLLAAGEADRLSGWSYQDETGYIIFNVCPGYANAGECTDCLLAVTRQIYGY